MEKVHDYAILSKTLDSYPNLALVTVADSDVLLLQNFGYRFCGVELIFN
jgi:hypothetical protein